MEYIVESSQQKEDIAASEHVKCPSCGGEMSFSPDEGKLVCSYCGQKKETDSGDSPIQLHEYGDELQTDQVSEQGRSSLTVHCSNCGANISVDPSMAAQVCPFCGSPMAIQDGDSDQAVPDAVLPFQISQKKAVERFQSWVKSKFFSPGKLKTMAKMQKLSGVYIPHFLFNCRTSSMYTAEAGTHYYETEWVTVEKDGEQVQEEQQVQKTSWESVSGIYTSVFFDRMVNASKNIDRKLIQLHFDVSKLKPYAKDYLYGFEAENVSISKDDCWSQARESIDDSLRTSITNSIGADEVRNLSFSTDYQDLKYKLALLPVWISVYKYKDKLYKFMINGETGEVKGQAPVSASRVLVSILLTLGVPAILFALNPAIGVLAFIAAIITLIVLANRKPK